MSLVTGTARTGEVAAVAEAPLLNGKPLIFAVAAMCTWYTCVRLYEQDFGWAAGLDSFAPEFTTYWMTILYIHRFATRCQSCTHEAPTFSPRGPPDQSDKRDRCSGITNFNTPITTNDFLSPLAARRVPAPPRAGKHAPKDHAFSGQRS